MITAVVAGAGNDLLGAEDPFVGLDVFDRGRFVALCEGEFFFGRGFGGRDGVGGVGGVGGGGVGGVCLGGSHFGWFM